MANDVTIDLRYSKYTNKEIERILDSVETIDTEPTADSPNPVSSGAVAAALAEKQDVVTLASEQDVIDIVENFGHDTEPEPEEEP